MYKLSENLAQALIRPFFVQKGFSEWDIGIGTAVVGMAATILGTLFGGLATKTLGLGRALWIFGIVQMSAHLGYAAVAADGLSRPLLYAAHVLETGTSGLATGAFGVLLLRLTQKRFSATQYALLSSLFSISRVLTGPVAGIAADAIGWTAFFVCSVLAGVPGLLMLRRFVPWSVREPEFEVVAPEGGRPLSRARVVGWSALAGTVTWAVGLVTLALLAAIKAYRAEAGLDVAGQIARLMAPAGLEAWLTAGGLVLLGLLVGVATAAALVARRGIEGAARA